MFFKKKNNNYFYDSFRTLCKYASEEMTVLSEGLRNFDNSKLLELKTKVHALEHKADGEKKTIEEKLAKEFMTPIDREDIFLLLDEIDDLNDAIDEIPYKLYMRNYKELPPKIDLFINKTTEAIAALNEVFENFESINKKDVIEPKIKKVLSLEETMDKLYEANVRRLYIENNDYDVTRLGERVYSYFEYVTDKCRDVCKTVLIIMYKNL